MPFRSSRRRRSRRRRVAPRRLRFRRSRRSGFPSQRIQIRFLTTQTSDAVVVRLKLATISTEAPASSTTRIELQGNNAFSPDGSFGSTRQPVGFDSWSTLYNKYEVLASSVSTRIVNTSLVGPINWCVYPTYNVTPNLSYGVALGQRYAKSAFCDTLGSGAASSRIFSTMGTYKLLGRHSGSLNFTASVNTAPSKQWEWVYEFNNPEGSDLDFSFQTNITYTVRFYQPAALLDT